MKAFIFPYKSGSESCKLLSEALGIKRIAHTNSKFKGDENTLVINWGASEVSEEIKKCHILNKPAAVQLASNKLSTFEALGKTGTMPQHSTDVMYAKHWIKDLGQIVVERHKLTGNSGEGIRVVERVEDLQKCPLYVMYIPKKQEYRVHVANGRVVDVQRKARRHDVPDDQVNWKIRNHDNGFIFARHEELGAVPDQVLDCSVIAVRGLGLDFGAVDVVFNEKQHKAYVLEVNTAPGLSGATLEGYVSRFRQVIEGGLNKVEPVAKIRYKGLEVNPAAELEIPHWANQPVRRRVEFQYDHEVFMRTMLQIEAERNARG